MSSNPFFNNNRANARRFSGYGQAKPTHIRPANPSMNFTDNFVDYPVRKHKISLATQSPLNLISFHFIRKTNLHNSTMNKSRGSGGGPYFNRSFSNDQMTSSMFSHNVSSSDKPSFSSLFTSTGQNSNPDDQFPSESQADDDGVFLQISNLDQWYDEANLKNYLMSQLKPITPILSLNIETPSIAKVKVPSIQVRAEEKKLKSSSLKRVLLSLFLSLSPFPAQTVCQAGCVSPTSKENGTQANVRVIHEGQNVRRSVGSPQQGRWFVEGRSVAPTSHVKISRAFSIALQVIHQHPRPLSNA